MTWSSAELAELIDGHADRLALYARQWTSDPHDVVQEALLELLQAAQRPDDVLPWLYTVVRRKAQNAFRSDSRRRSREQVVAFRQPPASETQFDSSLDQQEVWSALEALEDRQRETVVLRIWSDLAFDQIANVLNVSVSTAHRIYHEALATLRKELGTPCPSSTPTIR